MKRIASILLLFVIAALPGAALAQPAVPQSRAQIALSFAPLVRQVTPAVVNIYAERKVTENLSPFFDDPLFQQFFGAPQGMTRERMERALGSGVIVGADGLVVTALHVIAGADHIRIALADRREFAARVILSDKHADLALLRLENTKNEKFPFLELGDSDAAQVGDLVLAVGDPFGVGQTVTMGIISALARQAEGANDYNYFIQTDAAINPGNSGGALVTMDGKLVGINSAIYSRDGGNMGIGFAVPSNLVKLLIGAAAEGKKDIVHPWTGIEGQEVTPAIAASLGLPQPGGVLVKGLNEASPAKKAGMEIGDVIVSVDGHPVSDGDALRYRVATLPLGAKADIGVLRRGKKMDIEVPMIAAPENVPSRDTVVGGRSPLTGAVIANLSPAVAGQVGLPDDASGVVVTKVPDNSLAAQFGIQPGDIVRAVNGRKIGDVADALAAFKAGGHGWRLTIKRGDADMSLYFRF